MILMWQARMLSASRLELWLDLASMKDIGTANSIDGAFVSERIPNARDMRERTSFNQGLITN